MSLELEPARVPCFDGVGALRGRGVIPDRLRDLAVGVELDGGRRLLVRPVHPEDPPPDVPEESGTFASELLGEQGSWRVGQRVDVVGGAPLQRAILVRRVRHGQTAFDVEVRCADNNCDLSDLAELQDAGLRWRAERGHGIRAATGAMWFPDQSQVAPRVEVFPPMFRLGSGPVIISFLVGAARLEGDSILDIGASIEIDLSYYLRRELRGRDRRLQVALGLRTALSLLFLDLGEGETSVRPAALLAPFVEARFFLMPEVFVPIRAGGGALARGDGLWFLDAAIGLGVMWP